MKKLSMVLIAIMISSCANITLNYDVYTKNMFGVHEIYDGDFGDIIYEYNLGHYTAKAIKFIPGPLGEVDSPKEALTKGYGDCGERALVFVNIAYVIWGDKYDIACVKGKGRAVGTGKEYTHCIVGIDGRWFDPINLTGYTQNEICFFYSFDEIFPNAKDFYLTNS